MRSTTSPLLLLLAVAAFATAGVQAATARTCAEDPYADPANDVCNPLRYIPTIWAAGLALGLYFVVAVLLTIQFFRHGGKFFLCLVVGAYCEAIGLAMRIPFRSNPHNAGIYIVEYLFVVLSPCAFLAADYILLGRLTAHLDGTQHLKPFNPRYITRIFVGSDVFTFLIQAAGGGLSTVKDANSQKNGGYIFLAGIALQAASFLGFTGLWAMFGYRMKKNDPAAWGNKTGWKPLYWALGFTCIGIIIRSIYRTVELSEGYTGYLNTHEPYFYFLDTLPLFISISTYVYFWPTKFLTEETRIAPLVKEGASAEEVSVGTTVTPPSGSVEAEKRAEEEAAAERRLA